MPGDYWSNLRRDAMQAKGMTPTVRGGSPFAKRGPKPSATKVGPGMQGPELPGTDPQMMRQKMKAWAMRRRGM